MDIIDRARSGDPGRTRVIVALLALYTTWSTTYLAIKFALESFPPFLMAGLRYFLVGIVLFAYLRFRGHPAPDRTQWLGTTAVGGLLLLVGNGGVSYAQQWVSTGIAAMVVGSTPIWTVLFSGIWNEWPRRLEWAGLAIAFSGLLVLNVGGELGAYPAAAAALVLAVASWSFGSAWSKRLSLPQGLMAGATQMLAGGALLLCASLVFGEPVPTAPSGRSIAALLYLSVFGSLVGYSAYIYLLKHVRASLATSYAYVNPVIAVLLGIWLAGERLSGPEAVAMSAILSGVVLVVMAQRK
jgi:drug/metabolite transporter (DMT)-like permease